MQMFGVDRQTSSDVDRLNRHLTHEMAEFLVDEFAVSIRWFTGESRHIYDKIPDGIESIFWRRKPPVAQCFPLPALRNALRLPIGWLALDGQ